jgi:ATP-dependent Clp protease ATP-binding subunit ClpA
VRPEFSRILDEARAHAKRLGHAQVLPIHLASALYALHPEQANELPLTSEQVAERLVALPHEPGSVADSKPVQSLLSGATDLGELVTFVGRALEADTAGPESDVAVSVDGVKLTSAIAALLDPDPTPPEIVDRAGILDDVVAALVQENGPVPLIVGRPGAGRTTLLEALHRRVAATNQPGPLAGHVVLRLRADAVVAQGGTSALASALNDISGIGGVRSFVVCLDDLEVMVSLGRPDPDRSFLRLLRTLVEHRRIGLVLTIAEPYVARLEIADQELAEELARIAIPPLSTNALTTVVRAAAASLAVSHKVTIEEDAVMAALVPPEPGEDRVHPGLAVERLDRACARARVRGAKVVALDDLRIGQAPQKGDLLSASELAERLGRRVIGQDVAIEEVTSRLAITHRQFDLAPDRPNGVFLFVGPTGVGKTELARALSAELNEGREDLIRLDMSEYVEDWSVSRLIGPQPGYVGYTEPEQWLTTRVRNAPRAVVLLDEIEKAHPKVWNVFLQVFDAGLLTDGRGNVARFSDAVVIMTSNLGSHAYTAKMPPGFVADDAVDPADEVIRTVRATMAPELVNRLDAIVLFNPLGEASIREIAELMIGDTVKRLQERGLLLEVDDAAVDLVTREGYDPAFGARHLRRAIERLVLEPLAERGPGSYRIRGEAGEIAITPLASDDGKALSGAS